MASCRYSTCRLVVDHQQAELLFCCVVSPRHVQGPPLRLDAICSILDAFPGLRPSRRGGHVGHTGRVPRGGRVHEGHALLAPATGQNPPARVPTPGFRGRLGGRLDEVSQGRPGHPRGTTPGHPTPQRSRNQRKPPPRGATQTHHPPLVGGSPRLLPPVFRGGAGDTTSVFLVFGEVLSLSPHIESRNCTG